MTNILQFPHHPRHKPMPTIIRQNFTQADAHLKTAHTQCDVLTECGRRWRTEALARWQIANAARAFVRLSTLSEAL